MCQGESSSISRFKNMRPYFVSLLVGLLGMLAGEQLMPQLRLLFAHIIR